MKKIRTWLENTNLKAFGFVGVALVAITYVLSIFYNKNFRFIPFILLYVSLFFLAIDENKDLFREGKKIYKILCLSYGFVFYNILIVAALILFPFLNNLCVLIIMQVVVGIISIKVNSLTERKLK